MSTTSTTSRETISNIATLGIDIGKNSCHVIGLDARGAIVLRRKLTSRKLEARVANMPPCQIGMEACVGAHHLARRLIALGHDARLMPAKYVRPYAKGQKNDFNDAEAIAEAVGRPTMKFVPVKSSEQLDLQANASVLVRAIPHHAATALWEPSAGSYSRTTVFVWIRFPNYLVPVLGEAG